MFWVISEIVSEPNVTKRVKLLKYFIKVASEFVMFYTLFIYWNMWDPIWQYLISRMNLSIFCRISECVKIP